MIDKTSVYEFDEVALARKDLLQGGRHQHAFPQMRAKDFDVLILADILKS